MSSALVLPFFRRSSRSSDWSPQEIAEFYRVESALVQSGLSVTTDRGISDEGDPWFVFCRADNDEVIAHFARIDYEYVVASSFQRGAVRGRDFRAVIRDLMDLHPLMMPVKRKAGQKVFLHPSALLLALLASAYFHSSEVVSEHGPTGSDSRGSSLLSLLSEKIAIVAAIALAATWLEHQASSALNFLDGLPLFQGFSDDKAGHITTTLHDAQADYLSQFLHSLGFGAHQSALSQHDASLLVPQEGDSAQAHQLPVPSTSSAPTQATGPSGDATTAGGPTGSLADNSQAGSGPLGVNGAPALGDSTGPATRDFVPIALGEHQPDVSAGPGHAGDEQSSGAVNSVVPISNDALQIALLESGNSSAQPVVLTTNPEPVDVALQQALQQVGFGASVLHDSATTVGSADGSTASGGAQATAVVSQPVSQATSSHATSGEAMSSQAMSGQAGSNSASGPPVLSDSQVEHVVATFLASTPNYEITVSGANVVILDTNASDVKSGHFSVETFSMSDGSTLSIVGIIHHPLALSA
jgi:hypothetical protein